MQAVLSSSDAQTGDHAKLLLEERVPTLSCCKQRFENPGGGWQTCSSTFFYLLLLLLFHINSSSAVKLKNIPGPPPPSSGCLHLHLFIAEKTGRKKVFPQEELCEGGRFHSGGREDKLLMNTPPPTSRLKSHQASESRDSGREKEISGDLSLGASATNSVVVNLQVIFVISNKPNLHVF